MILSRYSRYGLLCSPLLSLAERRSGTGLSCPAAGIGSGTPGASKVIRMSSPSSKESSGASLCVLHTSALVTGLRLGPGTRFLGLKHTCSFARLTVLLGLWLFHKFSCLSTNSYTLELHLSWLSALPYGWTLSCRETQIFSLSHARDMLSIPSFLISSSSLKFTIFLYLSPYDL